MIKLKQQGVYELTETAGDTKVLTLDKNTYAWPYAKGIGEILVTSHRKSANDHRLALGHYRLCEVKEEPELVDLPHLELSLGRGRWQGYLLPTGLPGSNKKRSRIVPTSEIITET